MEPTALVTVRVVGLRGIFPAVQNPLITPPPSPPPSPPPLPTRTLLLSSPELSWHPSSEDDSSITTPEYQSTVSPTPTPSPTPPPPDHPLGDPSTIFPTHSSDPPPTSSTSIPFGSFYYDPLESNPSKKAKIEAASGQRSSGIRISNDVPVRMERKPTVEESSSKGKGKEKADDNSD